MPSRPARLAVALAVLAGALAPARPGVAAVQVDASLQETGRSTLEPPQDASVRRWEHVILVRIDPAVDGTLGRAEIAASHAGAAVLDGIRWEATASHEDYRLLVRTRSAGAVLDVLRALRTTRGVLGATSVALPETPTYPGGPSFLESYTSPEPGTPSNADRVVMRHDMPPVADKRELLEMSDVLGSPSTGPDGAGGFTLNVSELLARLKEGAWRRREERLRNTPIQILPPASMEPGGSAP